MVKRSARVEVFADADPPLSVGASLAASLLRQHPSRIFLAGKAGAGKSAVASAIAGTHPDLVKDGRRDGHVAIPVCNHADGIKDEVIEWVSRARARALIPGERATFVAFCEFLGISPGLVESDLWSILEAPWRAMEQALFDCYDRFIPVQQWAAVAPGDDVSGKVAFVDRYKPVFRRSLQLYGEAIREISGNPDYWAERTVDRGLVFRTCLNADTRFGHEADLLHGAGWIGVYLDISDDTQRRRRPEMGQDALAHASEHGIGPEACDVAVDANRPLGRVVLDIAEWMAARTAHAGPSRENQACR